MVELAEGIIDFDHPDARFMSKMMAIKVSKLGEWVMEEWQEDGSKFGYLLMLNKDSFVVIAFHPVKMFPTLYLSNQVGGLISRYLSQFIFNSKYMYTSSATGKLIVMDAWADSDHDNQKLHYEGRTATLVVSKPISHKAPNAKVSSEYITLMVSLMLGGAVITYQRGWCGIMYKPHP